MKFQLFVYQSVSDFSAGQLSVSPHEHSAKTLSDLRLVLHSVQEVDLDVTPFDLDRKQLQKETRLKALREKKAELDRELQELEVA